MIGKDYIMGEDLPKEGIEKILKREIGEIHCSTRKNIPSEIVNLPKNLLFGLKFNL